MLTGEDVRVRGQKRRMREEMTLTLTLTLTIAPATWWSPRDEEGVRLEVDVHTVVTILNGPVEQQRIVARYVGHAPVKPFILETKRATPSVKETMRVANGGDVRQVVHAPRLLEILSEMRDEELLGGNNVCRDRKPPRLHKRCI